MFHDLLGRQQTNRGAEYRSRGEVLDDADIDNAEETDDQDRGDHDDRELLVQRISVAHGEGSDESGESDGPGASIHSISRPSGR